MKPMFSYMGSKYRLAKKYEKPRYSVIIEPFAGSAAYSLYWEPEKAILYDKNPIIVGIWDFLISSTEKDISSLPVKFDSINSLKIPQEAKWLLGFWVGKGRPVPGKSRSVWGVTYDDGKRCSVWGEPIKQRIISQLSKIKNWEVKQESYENSPNVEATWFIDPPYQIKGHYYPYSNINYGTVAEFCYSRKGQTIVCENEGATWMPFKKFHTVTSTNGKNRNTFSKEVVWYS